MYCSLLGEFYDKKGIEDKYVLYLYRESIIEDDVLDRNFSYSPFDCNMSVSTNYRHRLIHAYNVVRICLKGFLLLFLTGFNIHSRERQLQWLKGNFTFSRWKWRIFHIKWAITNSETNLLYHMSSLCHLYSYYPYNWKPTKNAWLTESLPNTAAELSWHHVLY